MSGPKKISAHWTIKNDVIIDITGNLVVTLDGLQEHYK